MKIRLFLGFIIFFFSAESFSYESYCFKKSISIVRVKQYLSSIVLAKDNLESDNSKNCIDIDLTEGRKVLFEKYLRRKYRFSTRSFSGDRKPVVVVKNCRIEILKIVNSNATSTDLSVRKKLTARRYNSKGKRTIRSQIFAGSGRPAMLNVFGEILHIICRPKSSGFYDLVLSLNSNSGESISTSVSISRGQSMNIGSIFDDLKDKERALSITKGIEYHKIDDSNRAEINLMILN